MSHHNTRQQQQQHDDRASKQAAELGGLKGVDFRTLGYHNPRIERQAIHHEEEGPREDPKADLWRGLEPTTVEHRDPQHRLPQAVHHIAGRDAARELTKRLPHIEQPRPASDPDQEPFDPVVHGFLREHPGVLNAPPIVPSEDAESADGRRPPRAKRIARSLADSPTMRRQMVDIPDEEVRTDVMDEQVAAPMDEVDPYADHRQFKPYI